MARIKKLRKFRITYKKGDWIMSCANKKELKDIIFSNAKIEELK